MLDIPHIAVHMCGATTATFDIQVPAHLRSQGHGSAAMLDLIEQIDELGYALDIWCEPDPEQCTPDQLAVWYGRFGFVRTGETQPGAIRMRRPSR